MTCVPCFLLEACMHTHILTSLSFVVSPVSVCLSSVALLSFVILFFLSPSSICLPTFYFRSFHSCVSTLTFLSLFLPPFYTLHSCLPASCPPCFLSSPIQLKLPVVLDERRYSFFLPTADLLYQSIGPYKEIIQRAQAASARCLTDNL